MVGSEVWLGGVIEPWIEQQSGSWAVKLDPEVGVVVGLVLEFWVVLVIGPLLVVLLQTDILIVVVSRP